MNRISSLAFYPAVGASIGASYGILIIPGICLPYVAQVARNALSEWSEYISKNNENNDWLDAKYFELENRLFNGVLEELYSCPKEFFKPLVSSNALVGFSIGWTINAVHGVRRIAQIIREID